LNDLDDLLPQGAPEAFTSRSGEDEPVPISALAQYTYCPRRAALILHGARAHEQADPVTSADGQARLARVAKVCKNFGQRVQMSVFECRVTRAQLEDMEAKLLKIIEPDKDSLRIYTLPGGREKCLRVHGQDKYTDFDDPLVV
jgi:CRISPR-associated protein Cas2